MFVAKRMWVGVNVFHLHGGLWEVNIHIHCRTMQFCYPFLDSWPVALRYLHNQMRSVSGRYRFRSNATSFFVA